MNQVRVARHTKRLAEVLAFYRDGLGLIEIGGFRDHDGYDGVFLALPGTNAHLEFTSGGRHDAGAPEPHAESLLVLYLGERGAVDAIAARLGTKPVAPANPYWAEHGLTFQDPDGFRVVLVPEHWQSDTASALVRVEEHLGPRGTLRPMFELAEDSAAALDGYMHAGRVLVALAGGRVVGHIQIILPADAAHLPSGTSHEAEIKNMATDPGHRGLGVGRMLMAAAIDLARRAGCRGVVVATAAADTGNLRFYQRLGFRLRSIERDAFTAADGYAPELEIDGVPLRDRVWLDLRLDE
jgi:ribosomal protein S18 acetylase RimI-like enzyme